ncbi:hypothetical protein DDB_G0290195 [Dictyostelium discoideum AX4]|uniref:Uncharacterized protein n=1 Tax=Dictyostelium discoideum TaxID=44689 RepID=Q54GF4_DICDI|nr:hypothetical protein DDB_G0290195 [Dictyostelium discoideum AX4]EAL62319.1 hypothetical protein DDB_G0290195 [Dictyostelium discoideum AX4]|eukprot:XP_635824.1 hypothetical protein DDB_G0290195 [Dictyostelium discoideum AX4]
MSFLMKTQSLSKKVEKNLIVEKRQKHNEVEKRSRLFRKSLIDKLSNATFDDLSDDEMGTVEEVLEKSVHFIDSILKKFEITDLNEEISNTLKSPNLINFKYCCNNNKNKK